MDNFRGEIGDAAGWLKNVPGYRDLLRERVSLARRAQRNREIRVLRREYPNRKEIFGESDGWYASKSLYDVDHIGREVDGCG